MFWKTMFIFFVFGFWCLVCQQWYVCGIKQNCEDDKQIVTNASTSTTASEKEIIAGLLFEWSNEAPIVNNQFFIVRDSLADILGEQDKLEITGFYFEEEAVETENIGLKRADQVKTLFLERIPAVQIQLQSKMLDETTGVRNNLFESIDFHIIKSLPSEDKPELIVETEEGILIYFPDHSIEQNIDIVVESYLQQLAIRLQQTKEKVHIIGHTDTEGDAKINYDIGRSKAKAVRDVLTKNGLSLGQITVFSKGETEPIASNETVEGRQQNRRIEIKIFE